VDYLKARIVLWVGPKHSGKTTAAQRLADELVAEGEAVAGILAPAIYQQKTLVGFEVLDIATGSRKPLAQRAAHNGADTGRFSFCPEGWDFGNRALHPTRTRGARLVVVDEFGPLELAGKGWRQAVDRLVCEHTGTILLVVREELATEVARLFARAKPRSIQAPIAPQRSDQLLRPDLRQFV